MSEMDDWWEAEEQEQIPQSQKKSEKKEPSLEEALEIQEKQSEFHRLRADLRSDLRKRVRETPKFDPSFDLFENKPAIQLARDLYVTGLEFGRISALTGINTAVWYKHLSSWKKMRRRLQAKRMEEVKNAVLSSEAEAVAIQTALLTKQRLDQILADPDYIKSLTPKQLKEIGDVAKNFHNIKQLEQGAPTEIVKNVDYNNLTEMRAYITNISVEMQGDYGEIVDYAEPDANPEQELREIEFKKQEVIDIEPAKQGALSGKSSD